jgi:radical SAM protein with 4Fe4S-binding SPASM domain
MNNQRKVKQYWKRPDNMVRQGLALFYLSWLTNWRKMPRWMLKYGFSCLPGAAGAKGMGCIGFPSHPVWEITTRCNLSCIHCHTSGGTEFKNELTTEEGKQLISQLGEIKDFQMMAYTGGEPLVREDLFELLAFSKSVGFANTLATNATLVDDDISFKLKRNGVVIAAVSLDGIEAETHDKIRNKKGAFEQALSGIRSLHKAGILLHINITAMNYNMEELKRLLQLVEELGTGILLMYQLVPVGRGKKIENASLDLSSNEELIKLIADAQKESNAIIEPVAGPQYWAYLLKQKGISQGFLLRLAEKTFHGCTAGRGFVYIKPDGSVWPCPFIEVNCGSIREQSFHDIWYHSSVFKDLRNRERSLKGQCGDCSYKKLCGGCRGRTLALSGDLLEEDPSCFLHDQ